MHSNGHIFIGDSALGPVTLSVVSLWVTSPIAEIYLSQYGLHSRHYSLASLFGSRLEGSFGYIIDIVAVVATILGIAQTLGFGVEQFVAGMHRIGFGDWLLNEASKPTSAAIVFAVLSIVGASTLSAISGVGKGIKWLSNLNMVLSAFLLLFFLGSNMQGTTFCAAALAIAIAIAMPVGTDPVKTIWSIFGWPDKATPASWP